MRAVVLVLASWLPSTALALDWYVEGPPVATRADAAALASIAAEQGYEARVLRRFRQGVGWHYVYVVEGFDGAAEARAAAEALGARTGGSVAAYESDGELARPIGGGPPASPGAPSAGEGEAPGARPAEPAATDHAAAEGDILVPDDAFAGHELESPAPSDDARVAEILARAIAAHAGEALPNDVLFRFRRTLAGGQVASHTYARRGADVYLEVTVEGEAAPPPSRTLVVGSEAWLVVGDAPARAQEAARAREVLARFAPEEILAFPLSARDLLAEGPEFRSLTLDGATRVDGRVCDVLRYPGDRVSPPLVVAIEAQAGFVRQLGHGGDAGGTVQQFDGWGALGGGVVVPSRLRTWRGRELTDDVVIVELSAAGATDAWFRIPPAE